MQRLNIYAYLAEKIDNQAYHSKVEFHLFALDFRLAYWHLNPQKIINDRMK